MAADLENDYILSKYQNVSVLSESDKSSVYLVLEKNTGKLFVKKIFPKDMDFDVYRLLKKASLKNLPQIFHIIEHDGYNCIIEEYIPGESLEAFISSGKKVGISQVVLWVTALCGALRRLHNMRPPIIHRGIKPSNVIIKDDTTVKLIDFDISRVYNANSSKDTRYMGTDYYAAPEQFGFAQTDCRTDIYAVGKLMLVLLTGRQTTFDESLASCGYLANVIRKCCEIDPANRYQNITELLRVLQLTIFDGFAKMPDEDIAANIALIETMTAANLSVPIVQKAGKGLVSVVNVFGGALGLQKIDEPNITDIWEQIGKRSAALRGLDREALDMLLLDALANRAGGIPKAARSQDIVSAKVIDEAAKLFDIPDNLTSAQKADCVFNRYSERLLENIQKELEKQNVGDIERTNQVLQTNIEEMSEKQREELRKALNVDRLTAETVRGALLKAGAPAAILAGISATSFGSYVAFTTIIHAIATTALGVTLPFAFYTGATTFMSLLLGPIGFALIFGVASFQIFSGSRKLDRELLAQVVWLSVSAYGGKFAPEE